MSKHFDRVNNRVRPGLTWNEKRPTVYRPEEFAPITPVQHDGGGAGGYDNLLDYWHTGTGSQIINASLSALIAIICLVGARRGATS